MEKFFGDAVLINNQAGLDLYEKIKGLPIVDYHCHLSQKMIKEDYVFSDIGEMWLKEDHYKWRAMRMFGVKEEFITGKASWHDKFIKYAEIVPMLIGNPLYYWTHFELKKLFVIEKPLNVSTA